MQLHIVTTEIKVWSNNLYLGAIEYVEPDYTTYVILDNTSVIYVHTTHQCDLYITEIISVIYTIYMYVIYSHKLLNLPTVFNLINQK